MRSSQQVQTRVTLPDPGQARTLDELIERLRSLKIWAGDPSYEVIKNQINAAWTDAGRPAGELTKKTTVVDCFRTGRRRVNVDLVIAVVRALHPDAGYVAQWHQALRVVLTETRAAAQVRAQDTLPEDLAEFTGRSSEIDRLRLRPTHGAGSGAAVVIAAIEGMAGVGKTRLAVHAGHLLAGEQPFDQTLFANLRGFHPDPAQPPADPAAVLDSFLRLLGVPGHQIPHDLSARTGLYRQRLAGMRALVVLDNAADEQQVEPLLPGSPGGLTLITSRRSLAGLRMATHLPVDVFTPDEAHDFLTRAVPGIPAGDDPTAAARVAQRCGYLPLALGLVAAHMRAKPRWTLTAGSTTASSSRSACPTSTCRPIGGVCSGCWPCTRVTTLTSTPPPPSPSWTSTPPTNTCASSRPTTCCSRPQPADSPSTTWSVPTPPAAPSTRTAHPTAAPP